MIRQLLFAAACAVMLSFVVTEDAEAQQAFGQSWGAASSSQGWERFYNYPYVYYPQNFMGDDYYRSADNLYYRYRPEMRIPVYNKKWHNYYPSSRPYHRGHQFILDVF